MAKSKLRGGAKAHRKRVIARSQTAKGQMNAYQKILKQQIELFKQQHEAQSATTENQ